MAKVGTHSFWIKGKRTEIPFYYTQKKRFYAVGIPEEVSTMFQQYFSGFDKEDDLYKVIFEALRKYHEKIKETRKVIAYTLSMTSHLAMNKIGRGHYQGYKEWVPEGFDSDFRGNGYGFVIEWKVLFEVSERQVLYYDVREDGTIGYKEHLGKRKIIDWTEGREKAFMEIDAALERLAEKVATVLADKERFTKLIDSGLKLLGE